MLVTLSVDVINGEELIVILTTASAYGPVCDEALYPLRNADKGSGDPLLRFVLSGPLSSTVSSKYALSIRGIGVIAFSLSCVSR